MRTRGGGGYIKKTGKLIVSFNIKRDNIKYSDFWCYLGCSGYEVNTLSRQDLVLGCT